ncbi:lysozyme [uncultured Dysosmobacter sp.]|uniref:lysozyme n=1 Tax=uncultured Dysosmobacter sp. TaxID=2591384 RepID=UPI002639FE04|nr:lysozyme [uncultured Dysosmobacter sp.]
MSKRPIGTAGLALIQKFEGCRLKAYKAVPTEKYWTIGWGHYGPDVQEGQVITQAQADALLVADCQRYADAVDDPANCPLTAQLNANQRDALISFTFNCGVGSLRTLCKGRTLPQIREAMARYNRAGGKILLGLMRRRAAEQTLFNTPVEPAEKEDTKMVYKYLKDIPEKFRPVIGQLMTAGIIQGDGSDPEGNGDVIDLTHEQVRTLVFVYRGGGFDRKLQAAGMETVVR